MDRFIFESLFRPCRGLKKIKTRIQVVKSRIHTKKTRIRVKKPVIRDFDNRGSRYKKSLNQQLRAYK